MSTPRVPAPRSAPPVELPLMDDVEPGPIRPNYSEIIRPVLQYELYNPAAHTIEFSFDAQVYKVPARDKHWRGRDPYTGEFVTYPKPGILPIWTPTAVPGKKIEYNARDIIIFACGPDGISGSVGPLGIRPLFGDDRDELVAEEAQSAWAEHHLSASMQIIRSHEMKVAEAKAAGNPPPFPGRQVLDAYAFRKAYESRVSFKYTCPVCNLGFRQSMAEVYVHLTVDHRDRRDLVEEAEKKLSQVRDAETGEMVDRPLGETDLRGLEPDHSLEKPLPAGLDNIGKILDEVGGQEVAPPTSNTLDGLGKKVTGKR
jgi:hypothetical protein